MCVGNRPLLRVGPFIIVRRYSYMILRGDGSTGIHKADALTSPAYPTGWRWCTWRMQVEMAPPLNCYAMTR